MTSRIAVPVEPSRFRIFYLRFYTEYEYIDVEGVCYIRIHKWHNHCYDMAYFFYHGKWLCQTHYNSKKELLGAIQNLLQEDAALRFASKTP